MLRLKPTTNHSLGTIKRTENQDNRRAIGWRALWGLLLLLCAWNSKAQTSVVMQHYDISRSGANTNETVLTPANVNQSQFGRLFSYPVDGFVYAQPLYLPGVAIPGKGTHNVLFVATEHDSVYAFDADSNGGANATPLWQITLLDAAHGAASGATTVPPVGTTDLVPEVGITGTPVIDPNSGTLYVVGATVENGAWIQRLHALDITTGAERAAFNSPVKLQASVSGNGNGSSAGVLNFDPKWENQRAGLLLLNGILYIGYAAHADQGPWHGWILAYNATTLQQTSVFCSSSNGLGGGIWMAGSGLAADVVDPVNHPFGRMFITTGNGSFDAVAAPYTNSMDYSDDFIRLDLTNGIMTVTDSFTPWNQDSLSGSDRDLASGGVLILPDQTTGGHTHLLVQVGKEGRIYLLDRDNLGGYNATTDTVVQEMPAAPATTGFLLNGLWGMPAYWNGHVYLWASYFDRLKSFSFANGVLSTSFTSRSNESMFYPGSTPSVSANGSTNGVVWTIDSSDFATPGPAILRAYDANDVSILLYASDQNLSRDNPGNGVKFAVPSVINGKVFVGAQYQVSVFGLLNGQQPASTPVLSPVSQGFIGTLSVSITDSTPGASIYYTTDGSIPTVASTLYSGPISINTTTTVNAIASATGSLQSAVASGTYTLQSQVAMPTFNPGPGTYSAAQSVTITSTTAGATIYYTTDGTTPTTASAKYTGSVLIGVPTTLNAIAVAAGLSNSPVSSGVYSILQSSTVINFGGGFSTSTNTTTFNGSTTLNDTRLQLTTGGLNQAGSAFVNTAVNIQAFTTDFTFQLANPAADGITFTIQSNGPTALGQPGAGLGYGAAQTGGTGGIPSSVAIKFDLFNNEGEGGNSTGLYTNGAAPTVPAIDLTPSGIDLHSGDAMSVHLVYDGINLMMTVTDNVTSQVFLTNWQVNIPSLVGGNTAYVGFTGGTSTQTSSQKIFFWTFTSNTATPTFSPAGGTYTSAQTVTISDVTPGTSIFYSTDGTTPTTSSTKYTGAITVGATKTINAIAAAQNFQRSAMASATYAIQSPITLVCPPSSLQGGMSITGGALHVGTCDTNPAGNTFLLLVGGIRPFTAGMVSVTDDHNPNSAWVGPVSCANSTDVNGGNNYLYYLASSVAATNGIAITVTPTANISTAAALLEVKGLNTSNLIDQCATNNNQPANTIISSPSVTTQYANELLVDWGSCQSGSSSMAAGSTSWTFLHSMWGMTGIGSCQAALQIVNTAGTYQAQFKQGSAGTYANSFVSFKAATQSTQTSAATPTFSPATGTYSAAQAVTISDATPGASIFYTTNGTTPTTSSTPYSGPITVSASQTINAIAVASGFTTSAVGSASYVIQVPAATPTFSPGSGTYGAAQTVTISDTTPGFSIYYTTNGTTPTTSSTLYTGPITVSASETINAIAVASGHTTSAVGSASYIIQIPVPAATPTFSPAGGTYSIAQTVTISDTTPAATIYYTTNGTSPTTSSTSYTGAVTVGSSQTINAIAVASGYSTSAVGSASYTIQSPITLVCPPTSLQGGMSVTGGVLHVGTCDANPQGNTFLLLVGTIRPTTAGMVSVTDDHNPNSAWVGPVACANSTDVNGGNNYLYYLASSVAATNGIGITVTPTANTSTAAALLEVKGLDTSHLIDQCATNNNQPANTILSTPSVTTQYANELLVDWGSCQNGPPTMAPGYTNWTFLRFMYGMTGIGSCQAAVQIVNTAGTYQAQFKQSIAGTYSNSFVSFKAAQQ